MTLWAWLFSQNVLDRNNGKKKTSYYQTPLYKYKLTRSRHYVRSSLYIHLHWKDPKPKSPFKMKSRYTALFYANVTIRCKIIIYNYNCSLTCSRQSRRDFFYACFDVRKRCVLLMQYYLIYAKTVSSCCIQMRLWVMGTFSLFVLFC